MSEVFTFPLGVRSPELPVNPGVAPALSPASREPLGGLCAPGVPQGACAAALHPACPEGHWGSFAPSARLVTREARMQSCSQGISKGTRIQNLMPQNVPSGPLPSLLPLVFPRLQISLLVLESHHIGLCTLVRGCPTRHSETSCRSSCTDWILREGPVRCQPLVSGLLGRKHEVVESPEHWD